MDQTLFRKAQYLLHGFIREFEKEHSLPMSTPKEVTNMMILYFETAPKEPMVIDNGSGFIKAGFAKGFEYEVVEEEKNLPRVTIPSIIQQKAASSSIHPIEHGLITDWDNMTKLWHNMFEYELGVITKGASVLMTEPPLNPKASREKMTEIMFEQFEVDKFYLAITDLLALFASGRTTGMVFSSGDDVSHTMVIYEGYVLPTTVLRLDIGGRHVTQYLSKLLTEKGSTLGINNEIEIVRDIKEKLGYFAMDYDDEIRKIDTKKDYELPDGRVIKIGSERFQAPEILFKPELIGFEHDGLHKMLYSSGFKADRDIRQHIFANILVTGGNTMFDGMWDRLLKEMRGLNHMDHRRIRQYKVIVPPERKNGSWIEAVFYLE